ncbi:unnamed protein product [Caenorhabditis bovis]|uniref:Uncharacterized protein n=1 Tax=Caenorhabditis bovis TaxID=2654633 RepID=A0A8S1EHH6_9PELO|nr:unnamed protein product [Caenorhabditis bovis]
MTKSANTKNPLSPRGSNGTKPLTSRSRPYPITIKIKTTFAFPPPPPPAVRRNPLHHLNCTGDDSMRGEKQSDDNVRASSLPPPPPPQRSSADFASPFNMRCLSAPLPPPANPKISMISPLALRAWEILPQLRPQDCPSVSMKRQNSGPPHSPPPKRQEYPKREITALRPAFPNQSDHSNVSMKRQNSGPPPSPPPKRQEYPRKEMTALRPALLNQSDHYNKRPPSRPSRENYYPKKEVAAPRNPVTPKEAKIAMKPKTPPPPPPPLRPAASRALFTAAMVEAFKPGTL